MPRDLRLPLREAVVQRLRASTALTALVPANAIHGERVPARQSKPYIALSRSDVEAFDAQGIKGGRVPIRVNVFADGEDSGPINKISATVVDVLDDAQLNLDEGWCLDVTYVRTASVPTGAETTKWQDQITFSALTGVGD